MYLNTKASMSQNLCNESIRLLSQVEYQYNESIRLLSQVEYQYNESIRLFRNSLHNCQKAIQSVLRTEYRRRDAIQLFRQAENLKDSAEKLVLDTFYNRERCVRLVLNAHILRDYLMNYRPQVNPRHKVFVSYYHAEDQYYRERFEDMFSDYYDIMVSESVEIDDIDPNLKPETIRQKIRDEYLRDSTVTVVLVGARTWQRKFVDWEIGSSIRKSKNNTRSGLLGILLPPHPDSGQDRYTHGIIPPRLHDNIVCGFAKLYNWSNDPHTVQSWIHDAFLRRDKIKPYNFYPSFKQNRWGERWN